MANAGRISVPIPDELVEAVSERRAIPFIGAGFGAALEMPDWRTLLRGVAERTEGALPFDDISRYTNGDLLQIAEYLFIKSYKQIGPIRYAIEQGMPKCEPIYSGPHVELVNLGSPLIYTTNYDDLIEDTYRALEIPATAISMPRDVAPADGLRAQVIKYHGDLRHDNSLVLTESSYYRRLDFESPMDLKFRSDLLGRSVLFIGYSFQDINIRIIWFKLTQMMKDIPEDDRRPSYIVRISPNPVLEELDRAVGLRTIVLDPQSTAKTDKDRSELVAEFLFQLGALASDDGRIPGSEEKMFVSDYLCSSLERDNTGSNDGRPAQLRFYQPTRTDSLALDAAGKRRVPVALKDRFLAAILPLANGSQSLPTTTRIQLAVQAVDVAGSYEPVASTLVNLLIAGGAFSRRLLCQSAAIDWNQVWTFGLTSENRGETAFRLRREIDYHESSFDEDLFWVADLAKRFIAADDGDSSEDSILPSLIEEASAQYPEIASYQPSSNPVDALSAVIARVEDRLDAEEHAVSATTDDGESAAGIDGLI